MPEDIQARLTSDVQAFVRIDSRGDLGEYAEILDAVRSWLKQRGIDSEVLRAGGRPVAVCGEVSGRRSGSTFVLNATLDTASFGDPQSWAHPPLSGRLHRGWLYGRGSADSKAGVAIFCHVLAALAREAGSLRGSMAFVFDVDEHSGGFGGIRRWLAVKRGEGRTFGGAMIGYPGDDRIVAGCRGFHRVTLTVHGVSAHSGSSRRRGVNAIARAAALVERLQGTTLPALDPAFPLPPQITVTRIEGGGSFSSVPDRCTVDVDIRLTPAFTAARARAAIAATIRAVDDGSVAPATEVRHVSGWPAYRLEADAPVLRALTDAARQVLGRALPAAVVGPSSVGNFLAVKGIGATSGFGVRYRNLHAADECIDVETLVPAYRTYLTAARALLT